MNSKRKGGSFERKVCKALSLWVTKGESTDVFWRSAMSGGRATVHHQRGVKVRQVGDVCAVAPEGKDFCERWFVECKNVRNLAIDSFLLADAGPLAKFWRVAQTEAQRYALAPMIVARARGAAIVVTPIGALKNTVTQLTSHARHCDILLFSDMVRKVPSAVAAMQKGKK